MTSDKSSAPRERRIVLRRNCDIAGGKFYDYGRAPMATLYKICSENLWRQAERAGRFDGAPVDLRDGFIHFSTAAQVEETAAKHFHGQDGLLLIAVDEFALGTALRYEVSRGGDLFPHLYAELDPRAVKWVKPLPLDDAGAQIFPALEE